MRYEDVHTWDDFEEYAKSTSPEARAEMERLDRVVEAIIFASDSLNEMRMGLELYNLDEDEELDDVEDEEAKVEEEEPEAVLAAV